MSIGIIIIFYFKREEERYLIPLEKEKLESTIAFQNKQIFRDNLMIM